MPQFCISEENGAGWPWTKVNLWLIHDRDCTRGAGGLNTVIAVFSEMILNV